jgi:hypothetical protein
MVDSDYNDTLLKEIFPKMQYAEYQKARCLLDPYNINLNGK